MLDGSGRGGYCPRRSSAGDGLSRSPVNGTRCPTTLSFSGAGSLKNVEVSLKATRYFPFVPFASQSSDNLVPQVEGGGKNRTTPSAAAERDSVRLASLLAPSG